jgi:uncharacterized iron-regulated membrane protein
MKIFFRKLHRWLGLLMAVQIIAWMASGLYFSLIPIAEIRGEHLTPASESLDSAQLGSLPGPDQISGLLDQQMDDHWSLGSLKTVSVNGQILWRVEGESAGKSFARLVAPDGKSFVPRLSGQGVKSRAGDWLLEPAEPVSVDWVESVAEGAEFRGRALPVWRVAYSEPESVNLYIDPWTGELLARRTDRWRIFDFLWMLHIMDFDTRDDFNHPLLQVAAALGLIIALSGVVFWAMTTRLFRRRKKPVAALAK